jgi:undecaprenyl-diphosphatase
MAVAAAMLGEVAIFSSTTIVVGRKRPAVPHLDGSPPTSSFPSGHTAASTTLYGLLAIIVFGYTARVVVRALAVAVAVVIPVAIGISRLYRGMHFPSDVGGGILLGVLWFTVVGFVVLRGRFPADHHGRAEVREPAPGSVQR